MSRMKRGNLALALSCGFALACGVPDARAPAARAGFVAADAGNDERKLVKTAALDVEVKSLAVARGEVERIVAAASGLIEQASDVEEERVTLTCRVPSDQLESVMARIEALGDVTHRSLTQSDVTDQYFDLETRLANAVALRDRLRKLLDRASDVDDVITVERELTRVQVDVETMQAQLDRLKSRVARSTLTVTLERGRVLGPLGFIGYGVWWAVKKLFVIR